MFNYFGIIFALIALLSWGVGDFLLQRSTRKFGDWESLFIISIIGSVILFPFVFSDLALLSRMSMREIIILFLVSLSFFASALINVEALKRGKLAVIESVGAVEIPVAGILALFVLAEKINSFHWLFVFLLLLGILLVALKTHHFRRETWVEKGAVLALLGAVIMGLTDFMVGLGSRITNPILTVWAFNIVIAVIAFFYLLITGRFAHFIKDFRFHKDLMTGVGILDNLGWLSFAISTRFIPIVVALVLSESYIILATLLGIFVNKERLRTYQIIGITLAIIGATILSLFYS